MRSKTVDVSQDNLPTNRQTSECRVLEGFCKETNAKIKMAIALLKKGVDFKNINSVVTLITNGLKYVESFII